MWYSCPRIASRASSCGQKRSRPVGFTAPWKSTINPASKVSASVSSYHFMILKLGGGMKSILMPTAPAATVLARYALRAAGFINSLECTQMKVFTPIELP